MKHPFLPNRLQAMGVVLKILRHLSQQRSFLSSQIQPILDAAIRENDGSLSENDFKKINHYYGLAVPAILGEAFCLLHGRKLSAEERVASTSQGAMTGLFDDFFDRDFLSESNIESLMNREQLKEQPSNQQLFTRFYQDAWQHCPQPMMMLECLRKVYDAQVKSKQQTQLGISDAFIESVTIDKGGSSLIFYRSVFDPPPSTTETKMLFHLGALMQLCNDIFDVYKDRESGIQTMVTRARQIAPVKRYLSDGLATAAQLLRLTGFPVSQQNNFMHYLSVAIFNRAFVCLQQLEANEALSGGEFKVSLYSRQQLICDMDTWKNKWRSLSPGI